MSPTAPSTLHPEAPEPVLSTLNRDGTRRWMRPKPSRGRFYRRRFVLAWILILVFTAVPYLKVNGRPLMLLDIARREFTLAGVTFLSTDTLLLMLFLVSVIVAIFLLTAVLGRVWCGWACPQTVYMEFLYRPLERLIEGTRSRQMKLDRDGPDWRRLVKYGAFVVPSLFLAHTFLAYFVGVDRLATWVQGSPLDHPIAFAVMALTSAAMYLDFTYFREQVCLVACPYGRLQSVLLDRDSRVVGYDRPRGEPRGKIRRDPSGAVRPDPTTGDCIDCKLCVATCPTGIDIREGLQMECIHCTQCIDACDEVMDRVGRSRGLVRYASPQELEGGPRRFLRPRVIVYPTVLAVVIALLVATLANRQSADVTVLRTPGAPYTLVDDEVHNRLRVKVVNRDRRDHRYTITIPDFPEARIKTAQNPLAVRAGASETAGLFVLAPAASFSRGRRTITIEVADDEGFRATRTCTLLGPYRAEPSRGEPPR